MSGQLGAELLEGRRKRGSYIRECGSAVADHYVLAERKQERVARLAGGRVGRVAKLLGDHQRLVVVTRERGERLGPLHGREAADVTRAAPCYLRRGLLP